VKIDHEGYKMPEFAKFYLNKICMADR